MSDEPKEIWVVETNWHNTLPWAKRGEWLFQTAYATHDETETFLRSAGRNHYRVRRYVPDTVVAELVEALKEIDELLHGELPITRMVKEIAHAVLAKYHREE